MSYSTFRAKPRAPYTRPERVTNWPLALAQTARAAINTIASACTPQPKTEAVRSEPYRRLVAAMPCKACGIQGYSQAAHLPPEGKGVKQDDRLIFPLCCARVGIPGCHADFDQYRMFSHEVALVVGMGWAMDTMRAVTAAGKWPAGLPVYVPKLPLALETRAEAAIKTGA